VVNCEERQREREEKIHTPEAMANKFTDQQSLTMGTAQPSQMKYASQVVKGPVQVAFSDMSLGHECSESLRNQGG
jgi:hypothetical protein